MLSRLNKLPAPGVILSNLSTSDKPPVEDLYLVMDDISGYC